MFERERKREREKERERDLGEHWCVDRQRDREKERLRDRNKKKHFACFIKKFQDFSFFFFFRNLCKIG